MKRLAFVVAALSSMAGCAADEAERPGGAACEGKCDGTARAPIVSCVIAKDEQSDAFFRNDQMTCTYAPANGAEVVLDTAIIEVQTAHGRHRSHRWTTEEPITLEVGAADAYPLQVQVTLVGGDQTRRGLQSLDYALIEQDVTLASPDDATAATPATFALPFNVWSVRLGARAFDGTYLALHYEIPGIDRLDLRETVTLPYGIREDISVVVPVGASSRTVKIGSKQVELDGPGTYDVTTEGDLARVAAPAPTEPVAETGGEPTALCSRAVQQIGLNVTTKIDCRPIADPDAVAIAVDIEPSNGSAPTTVPLTTAQTIELSGRVDAKVSIRASIRDSVTDLSMLTERELVASTTLTDSSPDLLGRLPVTILRTTWTADGAVGILEMPAREIELGDRRQFLVRARERSETFTTGSTTMFLATTPGVPVQATGTVLVQSTGELTSDLAVAISTSSNWRITPTGFESTP